MDKYENITVVGEGSYGLVMKCRHRETGQMVAIKKFIETEEDSTVRKMALREIRMLKKLRHENLVNMIEVFRRKRRFYLVFEYMDHTVLDELEENPGGLGQQVTRSYIFQVIRGIDFCHSNNIVHRDVKPENVLVSRLGVVKLCDFGFARFVACPGETFTDYVATRWYRAPELLVGDTKYGKEVDIWAIGCLFAEMMSGDPLFPGDSDIDQLFQIVKVLGRLSHRHQQLIARNPMFKGLKRTADEGLRSVCKLFPSWPKDALEFLSLCLKLDPAQRPSSDELLKDTYFTHDHFPERILPELRAKMEQEYQGNPLLQKSHLPLQDISSTRVISESKFFENADIKRSGLQHRRSYMQVPRWNIDIVSTDMDGQKNVIDLTKPITLTRRKMSEGTMMEVVEEDTENKTELMVGSGNMCSNDALDTQVSPSPTSFKSLQVHQVHQTTCSTTQSGSVGTEHGLLPIPPPPTSVQQVLHPSINNLSFTGKDAGLYAARLMEPLKRSPLPLGSRLKEPVTVAPRTHLMRRLDRNLLLDVNQQHGILAGLTSDMSSNDRWFGNRRLGGGGVGQNNCWRTTKASNNDFSLPNVPGASGSPNKGVKKKLNPVNPQSTMDPFISPHSGNSATN